MTIAPRVSKKAIDPNAWQRPILKFPNARAGFTALLQALDLSARDFVLLPAYVGWSKHEGSGVFDPVSAANVSYGFYRMTRSLAIDLDDLAQKLNLLKPRLVVFIHYFGWPDSQLEQAIDLARQYGALILEDEAHALYSDYVTGMCGRLGDAAIVSLHKMLPFEYGGWLILNRSLDQVVFTRLKQQPLAAQLERDPFDYDLVSIAERRCQHARFLLEALVPLRGQVEPLHSELAAGVIPQTLPILIYGRSRDELYFQMNEAGFGVVSLYHTLIDEIRPDEYPDSHWLAQHIMNLPVHQDALPDNLFAMVNYLSQLVR